jgi:hypothetical protein
MRRQGQYIDSGMNPMMQQQNIYPRQQLSGSAHSMQDPMRPADAHYSGASRPVEGQWHRDHDSGNDPNKISTYSIGYSKGECHFILSY